MVDTLIEQSVPFYDYLMQNLREGVLMVDAEGIVTAVTHDIVSLLGCEATELVGKPYTRFWPNDLPHLELTDSSAVHYFETAVTQPDGRRIPVALTIIPATSETPMQTMVSITELNRVHQLNEALSHTQRLAGIGTLTASVAHELNTPISIIISTCSNMKYELEDNNLSVEQLQHYIQMIEQSAWRSARIMELLRDYSFDNNLQNAVTDLNMVIENALTLVRHQFQGDYKIELSVDLQPEMRSIVCDHNRLTQVVLNLLINARDAMLPQGGTISVKSWEIPESDGVDLDDTYRFGFSVCDEGHGIAPGILEKVFDPFFTTKPVGKGTGLGLFVARRIVEQHNGRITVTNNPDDGVTFTVLLP